MTTPEPSASAKAAGLRYTSDDRPGIRRVKRRAGFGYIGIDGKPLADQAELARIRTLAIPPAYRDVWISPDPRGHLQATRRARPQTIPLPSALARSPGRDEI